MKYYHLLESIANSLVKISETSIFDSIIPFLFGLLSSLIGIYFGYKISNFQDNKKIKINYHFEYLKHVNVLTYKINKILNNIVNIDKFCANLLGTKYNSLSIVPINDFYMVCLRINTLRAYLNNTSSAYNIPNTNKIAQFNEIMKMINDVLEPNLLVNIYNDFERDACNYYFLINKKLRVEYDDQVKKMQAFSINPMVGMDLEMQKGILLKHIRTINEIILSKKIKND